MTTGHSLPIQGNRQYCTSVDFPWASITPEARFVIVQLLTWESSWGFSSEPPDPQRKVASRNHRKFRHSSGLDLSARALRFCCLDRFAHPGFLGKRKGDASTSPCLDWPQNTFKA